MDTNPNSNWFYSEHNQQLGPVSFAELQQKFAAGMSQSTLVWTQSMSDWIPASEIPQLTQAKLVKQGNYSPPAFSPPADANNPYAAPVSTMPGHLTSIVYAGYANFWHRFCAAFVDGIITTVIAGFIGGIFGVVVAAATGTADAEVLQVGGNIVGLIIGWLYAAFLESSAKQATWGKQLMKIRVTDLEGNRISFGRATGRHFGKYISMLILFIGYLMNLWTEKKQTLHDIMAGCLVMSERR